MNNTFTWSPDELYHHGIKGQKWGIRRYQNPDGTLTEDGKRRYSLDTKRGIKHLNKDLNREPWATSVKSERQRYYMAERALAEQVKNKYGNNDQYKTFFNKKRRNTLEEQGRAQWDIINRYNQKYEKVGEKPYTKQLHQYEKNLYKKERRDLNAACRRILKKYGYKSEDQFKEENAKASIERRQLIDAILESSKNIKLSTRSRKRFENNLHMKLYSHDPY